MRLWDTETGEHKGTLTGHAGDIVSVAFSPDGKMLASGSGDGTVWLWDAVTGEQKRIFSGQTSSVSSVAFSPDGTLLASGGTAGTVILWKVD